MQPHAHNAEQLCAHFVFQALFSAFAKVSKTNERHQSRLCYQHFRSQTHGAIDLFGQSYIKVNVPPVIHTYIFVACMSINKNELSYIKLFLTALDPRKYIPVPTDRVTSKGPIVPISTESVVSPNNSPTTERRLSSERRRNFSTDIRQSTATSKSKM